MHLDLLKRLNASDSTCNSSCVDWKLKLEDDPKCTVVYDLKKVEGVGPKVFEQCAGFLRVHNGTEPLDATGIHPEAYGIVRRLAETAGKDYPALIGDGRALDAVDLEGFA